MTRKTKRGLVVVAVLIICTGAAIGYKMWHKPFKDALSGDAIVVTAENLLGEFTKDEQAARKKYVPISVGDKVVEVSGKIKETGTNTSGETFYILKAGGEMSGVKVVLDNQSSDKVSNVGDEITVRGFCNGYLADEMIPDMAEVIVNRAKIVSK